MVFEDWPAVDHADLQFLIFKNFTVGPAQNREQYLLGCPVHVEELRVTRLLAFLENIEPPWVLKTCRHVVRNDVEQQAHPFFFERTAKSIEFFGGADLRIELRRIRNVVAVGTSGPCLQKWLGKQIRDSESMKIVDDL